MDAAVTETSIDDLVDTLAGRVTSVLDAAGAEWSAPSPCEGWTAADVLDHLVDTEAEFLTTHGVVLDDLPEGDRDTRWRAHARRVVDALSDPDVAGREFEGYFGPTTVGAAFRSFYSFDLVVHRWDIARALGADTTFSEDELDLVEECIEATGPALYGPGICAAPVAPPADATRQERVLALLGRDPR